MAKEKYKTKFLVVIFLGVFIMSYREMKLDKEIIRKRIDIKS